jgi:hypothetical protein
MYLTTMDCTGGTTHKEIFAFTRIESGKEWESVVRPVIEKWSKFVAELQRTAG